MFLYDTASLFILPINKQQHASFSATDAVLSKTSLIWNKTRCLLVVGGRTSRLYVKLGQERGSQIKSIGWGGSRFCGT